MERLLPQTLSVFSLRLISLFFFLGMGAEICSAEVAIPPLSGRVIDQAHLLNSVDRAGIEGVLSALEREKGTQVVILSIPSTAPETMEQYSIRVVEAWKLGRSKIDDGVLFLIAPKDRAARFEVGYGLEGAVPDAIANRILDERVLPNFRVGDYSRGIREGVEALTRVIRNEPLPPPKIRKSTSSETIQLTLFLIFFAGPIGGQILKSIFGPFLGSLVGGGLTFLLASFALSIAMSIFCGVIAFFFILLSDSLTAISPYRSRSYRGYGGGFGGFGGGGGSSGGFSGGGGNFGGGGATGRW